MEAFARQAFDLVFMDLQRTEMGGKEATQRIRRQEEVTGLRTPWPLIGKSAWRREWMTTFPSPSVAMNGRRNRPQRDFATGVSGDSPTVAANG
jgi:CheY-like chemotaxis protein